MRANNKLAIAGVSLASTTAISTIIANHDVHTRIIGYNVSQVTAVAAIFGVFAFFASFVAVGGSVVALINPIYALGKPVTIAGFAATMLFSLIAFSITAAIGDFLTSSLALSFAFMVISFVLAFAGLVVAVKLPAQNDSVLPKSQFETADPLTQVYHHMYNTLY